MYFNLSLMSHTRVIYGIMITDDDIRRIYPRNIFPDLYIEIMNHESDGPGSRFIPSNSSIINYLNRDDLDYGYLETCTGKFDGFDGESGFVVGFMLTKCERKGRGIVTIPLVDTNAQDKITQLFRKHPELIQFTLNIYALIEVYG